MARDFNGTTDIISAGSPALLDDVYPKTLCAWIFADTLGENSLGRIFNKATGNGPLLAWHFTMIATASVTFSCAYATTNLQRTTSDSTVSLSAWHHMAVSWDGSATATNAHIYIDGSELSYKTTIDGVGARDSDATANFLIGNSAGVDRTFDGRIAEACFYNVILTPVEIQMVMRGLYPRANSILGYWPLYGATSPEQDWSGNNNHGTLTGTARIDHPPGIGLWMPTRRIERIFGTGTFGLTGVSGTAAIGATQPDRNIFF